VTDIRIVKEQDAYYISEGTHNRLWEVLGAHPASVDGTAGTTFAVWAPAARGVAVAGDFNDWHESATQLVTHGSTGIWETFVPGAHEGQRYKFIVTSSTG